MKIFIQKVLSASVEVDKKIIGSIQSGLLLYVGFTHTDTEQECLSAIEKIRNLRLFPSTDKTAHFDRSIEQAEGELLVISQFTLYGNLSKGRRPSFDAAMKPEDAKKIYDFFVESLKHHTSLNIQTGEFGAHMLVSSINNGPVTFILEI